jgi:hypothetical protein
MATETLTTNLKSEQTPEESQAQYPREPLKLKGALDQFESFDVTPVIGREFANVNLKEWLRAPNSDDLIRDLAIISILSVSIQASISL